MLAWRGLPPEMRDSPVLGPGAALLQRLIQTRGAVCTTIDAAQVPGHPVHLRQELAWTLIPVQAREGVLGVLHLIRAPEPPLSARAIQILVSIGNQIGLALDNRRLLEETSQMDLLREADRLRSELIANASHELRTPLGLIKVFSTALLMDELSLGPEKQAEFVQGIAQETANLEGIVDNLLDLGRMESGQLRLDRRRIDLSLLARKAAAEIEPILDGHRLARELADGPLWAEVDPRRIEQVLRNLLTNAKKYSPPGSEIALRTARVDQEIVICVQDEGIGIAPQDQERIFERFYRADNEVTRRVRGAGLGLSICKWIAEAHGGEIRVQSALQRGSTFCLALPAAEDAPEAQ